MDWLFFVNLYGYTCSSGLHSKSRTAFDARLSFSGLMLNNRRSVTTAWMRNRSDYKTSLLINFRGV